MLVVGVEVQPLLEVGDAVEVGEHIKLGVAVALALGQQVGDDRPRVNLLLDVDRRHIHVEVAGVLLVLALPDQLRVQRRVARVAHHLGRGLIVGQEVAQFVGRDVLARRRVAQ